MSYRTVIAATLVTLFSSLVLAQLKVSPASLKFATQALGTTSAQQQVTVTNSGSGSVSFTSITITGNFSVASSSTCSVQTALAAGASCNVKVAFKPTQPATNTGTLTLAESGGTQTVSLHGTGTAALLSTSSLTFSQYLNVASAVQAVSISNVGPNAFNVTGISVSLADYSEVNSCIPANATAGKLLPNAICSIYVTFTPTAAGSRPGTMSISGGGGPAQAVALKGTGVTGVGIALSPAVAAITNTAVLPLTAMLTGTTNNNVTWSASGGTITATGPNTANYTPPTTDGPYTVTATSAASTSSTATMTVTVTDYPGTFTYHNDNARDGQNQGEIVLNPSNVNPAQFGKLFSYTVDGQVYAQPLYVANVNMGSQGTHNVLYVATENNSVYAFDADGLQKSPLWGPVNFGTPVPSTAISAGYDDLTPKLGITGTPVIDPSAQTLFVVSKTMENGTCTQQLHALNIVTGTEQANSPVVISASITTDKKTKKFDPLHQNQRPALLLLSGVVYIAWGSHGDIGTYHGWVMGYSETTLAQVSAYITTPVDSYGGIWQAGGGPAADSSGNIYVTSGNGPDDVATGGSDYSGAFIKLSTTSGLDVADYFKPSTKTTDNALEMSSGGPILLPTQSGTYPHVAIVAGKDKNIYLVNRDSMGGTAPPTGGSQLLQTISQVFKGGVFSTPSFWKNNVYFWAETDILRSFQLQNGQLVATATYPLTMGYPGAGTSVSSKPSQQNGILWALDAKGVLHAFDATSVAHEFYNSTEEAGDSVGTPVKFAVPTVANGKVYVGGASQVSGYGLLPQPR